MVPFFPLPEYTFMKLFPRNKCEMCWVICKSCHYLVKWLSIFGTIQGFSYDTSFFSFLLSPTSCLVLGKYLLTSLMYGFFRKLVDCLLISKCSFHLVHKISHISIYHWNTVFEQVTKNAVRGLWACRSKLNLVGAHINVFTGEWTQKVTYRLLKCITCSIY